jgi:hypothetical protein
VELVGMVMLSSLAIELFLTKGKMKGEEKKRIIEDLKE